METESKNLIDNLLNAHINDLINDLHESEASQRDFILNQIGDARTARHELHAIEETEETPSLGIRINANKDRILSLETIHTKDMRSIEDQFAIFTSQIAELQRDMRDKST